MNIILLSMYIWDKLNIITNFACMNARAIGIKGALNSLLEEYLSGYWIGCVEF
ncbi:MAG: hypothetical protein P857_829 [Candidatus Xenolissoclinum pacificiensis L6]|uniref:Uncharacterized protein n=1 Tax=Candidatus Xenolissoclinum pacificiensis L6 TaxID=1401685 RepID=W2V094_9RICK|nr:MAG: hypothetical protein P857_829 [Candidatus Xenolissoclinum pacificiensis L6]